MLVLSVLGVAAPRVAVVLAVLAQGIVEDFPPGEEQDGLFILGSAASVEFRLDAPGNRDLILFRLVYTDGVDTHGWTEVALPIARGPSSPTTRARAAMRGGSR
ncbi:MAG TPA: hypothetical protein VGC03_00395 [Acidimicrobiia bacterium]|jgi:hypothetical protein